MLKQYSFGRVIKFRQAGLPIAVLMVGALGTYFLISGQAATPYASINASTGTLANGATSQACSGASNGNCVMFGATSSGTSNLIVGLDAGGWGAGTPGAKDVSNVVKYVRYDASALTEPITDFSSNGVKVDVDFSGPYEVDTEKLDANGNKIPDSGVQISQLNASTWASNALSWYQSNCNTTECPMIEVLNEPGGTWFWGSNALSLTNATAYANLVKTAYTTFHNAYGASAPLILATYDGSYGSQGDETFGKEWWSPSMSGYVNGIIVHPYGGTSSVTQSALGNRTLVTDAHNYTSEPVYVTEVGWPTAVGQPATGDSLQWSETDQCNNIYNFITWARGTGYVNSVMYFNYVDYGTNAFYGILRWNNPAGANGSEKPSYTGLKDAAQNQPNPC